MSWPQCKYLYLGIYDYFIPTTSIYIMTKECEEMIDIEFLWQGVPCDSVLPD